MIRVVTIYGELTDLNAYVNAERTHRFRATSIKKDETARVASECVVQKVKAVEKYPVHIVYTWYSPNRRKDIDNVAFAKKFINDGLVDAGVLEGDGRKQVASFEDHFEIDKDNPRVEVEIQENI
jgi:Holliday junction resolvase RusA-like endonuclease